MEVLGPLTISLAVSTVPLVRAADMYLGAKWEADAVVVITRDWYWSFHNGAREVCYEQETVHGGSGVQYELREVATGRLLARFEPGQGGSRPRWVEELEASRGAAARPDRLCVGMRNGFPGRLRVRLFGKADPARGQR